MTQPTLTVELGYLSGWTLGTSLLGTSTYLATVTYSQDISADVRSVSIRRGRQHELNRIEAGTASVQVLNQDGAMTRIPPMTNIRIRAVFDDAPPGPPFAPTDITGLVAWYDFSVAASNLWQDTARTSAVTADGQTIKGVTDKSSAANHLSEATNGPTYKTAIQNGLSIARFDGVNDLLTGTSLSVAQPTTIFAVAKRTAGATNFIFDGNTSRQAIYNGGGVMNAYAGTTLGGVAPDTSYHTWFANFNGASSKLYRDGVQEGSTGNTGSGALTSLRVGQANGGGAPWDGDMSELLFYNSTLSAANINLVGNYLATKWGLSWTTVV